MIELDKLTDFGRKQWTKRKFDEYEQHRNTKAIERSVSNYSDPVNEKYEDKLELAKWKTTIDKKVDYLLARKPVADGYQLQLDELADFIKESAKQYLLRGSLIWIVQGDGESITKRPAIISNTIAVYADESKETPLAFIRKYTDIEVQLETGAETEVVYYELYYGKNTRDTYCFTKSDADKIGEKLQDVPVFIELGKTGDAPLFAYVEKLLVAFDNIMRHQDTTVVKNTVPLTEVRGYTGTDDADLEYAVNKLNIVKTDGNGGVTIHQRSMDSTAIDLWRKAISQEYFEATSTVGKENELAYAQSGKAMDRLFVDMENSARDEAHVIEQALKQYFEAIGINDFDIVWNTDRPVDDTETINSIAASTGILSQKTLLENHPWVDNVEEELERLSAESTTGMEDLVDDTELSNEFLEEEEKSDGSIS